MTHHWTQEELAEIHQAREEGLTWRAIGKRYDATREQTRSAYRRYVEGGHVVTPDTVLDEWRQKDEKPTWRELVKYAEKGAKLQERMRPVRTKAKRVIRTDRPIFLAHIADLHLGSPTADYRSFVATTDFIMSDDRFYIAVVGADIENAMVQFRNAATVLNQVLPPYMQLEAYRQWLEEMLPRTVAICGDNHVDQRMERLVGDLLLERPTGVPFFPAYGILDLELDNGKGAPQTYTGVLHHKYKGSSIYHGLQPTLRMMRDIYPLADWYCSAHKHVPWYMRGVLFPELGQHQHFLVTGAFDVKGNLYSLRDFGGPGVLGLPTLVMWPDEKRLEFCSSPESALKLATLG
jgi:hypothetical protein